MRLLLEQFVLLPFAVLALLVGVVWSLQNPIVLILTLASAAIVFFAVNPFAKNRAARRASRHNKKELERISFERR